MGIVMLKLSNISKCFGEKKVIDSFSYDFKCGKITAILGESGCGKTTLLRCIAGLEQPDSGKITNDMKNIAIAFQEHRLLPWLTVSQNINLVLGREPLDNNSMKNLLENFELYGIENSFPSQLSGGMKQRVSLARAFIYASELILMDEPFSELDEITKSKIIKFLSENKKDKTIIYITHSQSETEKFADEIITFNSSYVSNENMTVESKS